MIGIHADLCEKQNLFKREFVVNPFESGEFSEEGTCEIHFFVLKTGSYLYDDNRVLVFLTGGSPREYFCNKSNPHESPDVHRRRARRIRTIGKRNDIEARLPGKLQAQVAKQVSRGISECAQASIFCCQSHHTNQSCGDAHQGHSATLTIL
jgi:hypothetical protein